MKKKIVSLVLSMAMASALLAGCGSVEDSGKDSGSQAESGQTEDKAEKKEDGNYTIAVVPKLTALAWYERMEEGVDEYAKDNGVDAFVRGGRRAAGTVY